MSAAEYEFHSPLSLLRQWHETSDAPVREVLITGYTLDLVFLERYCVPAARALGARVTVVSDPGQAVHEPVDVRHAGRAYQHGHAHCAGAFHPKVVVLLGDDVVWIAIGSGNPTMSGWGHNHELWLVLRTPRGPGPAALAELSRWLIELPMVVAVPTWIANTITDIGRAIEPERIDDSLPDLRIFGNLRTSILGQLPSGPADQLGLSAPFFDARADAVRALVDRFRPRALEIVVQPVLSQYCGPELVGATAKVLNRTFRFAQEDRMRHGKLVEWTSGSVRTALVGSANLSAAAMLATTAAGGNCELVASYPVEGSLLPPGSEPGADTVSRNDTIPVNGDERRTATLVILGARRLPAEIVVELVTTAAGPVVVETSPDGTPGTWVPAHVVTNLVSGIPATARFTVPEQLGGAVRLRADSGDRIVSSVVFLTDTQRCLPRTDTPDTPRLARDYQLDEIITDPALAARFGADLLRLLAEAQTRPTAALQRTPTGPVTGNVPSRDDRWSVWLHETEQIIGPSLTNLVFPGALTTAMAAIPTTWTVGPDADATELSDGETDEVVDSLLAGPADAFTTQLPQIGPSARQQWRAAARKLARVAAGRPAPPLRLCMVLARVYLGLLAAGIWGDDESWRAELSDIVTAVAEQLDSEATPDQNEVFAASLIAVCLALLLQDASLHGGGEHDLVVRKAWPACRLWTAFAEPTLVERYLEQPEQPYARVPTESEVKAVIDLAAAAEDDPHAELRAAFDRNGLAVSLIDGVWVVDTDRRNLRGQAAHVATLAGSRCAVLARNPTGAAIVLRDGSTVAAAESAVPLWRIYRLSPLGTPTTLLGGDQGMPPTRVKHPLQPLPDEIRDLTAGLGVNPTHLIAALLTRPWGP